MCDVVRLVRGSCGARGRSPDRGGVPAGTALAMRARPSVCLAEFVAGIACVLSPAAPGGC
jgi:hypothetical protein